MVDAAFRLILREVSLTVMQLIHGLLARVYVIFVVIQAVVEHLLLTAAGIVVVHVDVEIRLRNAIVPPLRVLLHVIWLNLIITEAHCASPVAATCPRGRNLPLLLILLETPDSGLTSLCKLLLGWGDYRGFLINPGGSSGTPTHAFRLITAHSDLYSYNADKS